MIEEIIKSFGEKRKDKPEKPKEPNRPKWYYYFRNLNLRIPDRLNYSNEAEYEQDFENWQKSEACKVYEKKLSEYLEAKRIYDTQTYPLWFYGEEYPELLNEFNQSIENQGMNFGYWYEKIKCKPKLYTPNLKSVKQAYFKAFFEVNGFEYKETVNHKEHNDLINLHLYWLFKHPKFYENPLLDKENTDIEKGLIIGGVTGTGKTSITKAFCFMVNNSDSYIVKDINGNEHKLSRYLKFRIKFIDADYIRKDYDVNKNEEDYYDFPLYINDLCAEYGQDFNKQPIVMKILEQRADLKSLTMASINFQKAKTKEDILNYIDLKYGARVKSRANQMFNFVLLTTSKDLRK